VQLRSLDGDGRAWRGTLLAFDGAYYQLDTIYGPITVAAEGVQLRGAGLPRPDHLRGRGPDRRRRRPIAEGLLPALLAGFAESLKAMTLRGSNP
jgi:phosphate transport system substrate-binding protein